MGTGRDAGADSEGGSGVSEPNAEYVRCPECGGSDFVGCGAAWHDGKADEAPSPVMDLATRIANYIETAQTYDQMSKREAMVEAVRLACEDARSDTLNVISGAAQRLAGGSL